jgi:hypothetical protein
MQTNDTARKKSNDSDSESTEVVAPSDPEAPNSPEQRIKKAHKQLEIALEQLGERDDPDETLAYYTKGARQSTRKAVDVIGQREDEVGRGEGSE